MIESYRIRARRPVGESERRLLREDDFVRAVELSRLRAADPSGRLEISHRRQTCPYSRTWKTVSYHPLAWLLWRDWIIQALIVRLMDYCQSAGNRAQDRNFRLEYESNIPQRLGLGGSSAIVTAVASRPVPVLRDWSSCGRFRPICPRNRDAGIGRAGGLQHRVAQADEGCSVWVFAPSIESRGYGNTSGLDPACCPRSRADWDFVERRHGGVPQPYPRALDLRGEPKAAEAMRTWAGYAERGRTCLLERYYGCSVN